MHLSRRRATNARVAWLLIACAVLAACGRSSIPNYADAPTVPTTPSPTAPATALPAADIVIDAAGAETPFDRRLLGTNVPAWLGPARLSDATFLARTKASGVSLLRMPGGSWSNTYNWLACEQHDASACHWPWAARPSDFITLLRSSGLPGMWTVALDQTPQQAAALVAFFNGEVDDTRPIGIDGTGRDWLTVGHWATLRRDHGNPEPVHLALWEVGNEVYGGKAGKDCQSWGWEAVWTCDGREYVAGSGNGQQLHAGFIEFRDAMHAVDPTIQVGAVGVPEASSWSNWGNEVIGMAGQVMDFYIVHLYAYNDPPASHAVVLAQPQAEWGKLAANLTTAFATYAQGRQVPIAVSEYNLVAVQDRDTQRYMTQAVNALFLADTIGQMATHGISIANQWDLANGTAKNGTDYGLLNAETFARAPQYYVYPLWARFGKALLPVESRYDAAQTLSVYAGRSNPDTLTLLAINKTDVAITTTIGIAGDRHATGGSADVASAKSLDATTMVFNGVDDPPDALDSVAPATLPISGERFTYAFAPYSITLLTIKLAPRE